MTTEQRTIFYDVIKGNSDMLVNAVQNAAEHYVITVEKSKLRTEHEVRDLAVAFFTEQLANRMLERLELNTKLI